MSSNNEKALKSDEFLDLLEERAAEYRLDDNKPVGKSYKLLAEWLGVDPWRVIIPLAVLSGVGMVLLLRGWAIQGVSLLQYGF